MPRTNYLATAPLDLFNANHDKPRHSPGTRCRYQGDEYMYVWADTALAARRACFALDLDTGRVAQTSGTTEKKVVGVPFVAVTDEYFTWVKMTGKMSVYAFLTTVGTECIVDANGYFTIRAGADGEATETVGIALATNAAANAGAAALSDVNLQIAT